MEKAQILQGLHMRNEQALRVLFDDISYLVRYFIEGIIEDKPEAEDITLHSFAKLWEQELSDFHSIEEVKAFIYKVAQNKARDYIRRKKVQENYREDQGYRAEQDTQPSVEENLYRIEMLQRIYEEVGQMGPRTQEVFKLVYLERINRNEVASHLKISVNTVNRLCSEAMQKLRNRFSGEELLILLLLLHVCKN